MVVMMVMVVMKVLFSSGMMGSRLEAAEEDQLQAQACLCYICAGNLEKLVSCWTKAQDGQCPLYLQVCVYVCVCWIMSTSVPVYFESG